jgi:hypothetical protein
MESHLIVGSQSGNAGINGPKEVPTGIAIKAYGGRSAQVVSEFGQEESMKSYIRPIGVVAVWFFAAVSLRAAPPLPGAIFTTNGDCTGVNLNIYQYKSDVYLSGGPAHPGAAGLPDGWYYVKVTEPDGDVLGASVEFDAVLGWVPAVSVHVTAGEFDECYQLVDILRKYSNASPGYDTTTNPGGVYKVWVSNEPTFPHDSSKTDNFKVRDGDDPEWTPFKVIKFYDANANGLHDDDEQDIVGWLVEITDMSAPANSNSWYTPVEIILDPGPYRVTEADTLETNWRHTTPKCVEVLLEVFKAETVEFGNVCIGPGGGKTLGFWSNKNGLAALKTFNARTLLNGLNLCNPNGSSYDLPAPTATLTIEQVLKGFQTWILAASATNMASMLSAQLAAMELNVASKKVKGDALVYAPGTKAANPQRFATVNALMAEANASLGANPYTPSGNPARACQEKLKNALDEANNDRSFVQPTPCDFHFCQ